MPKKQRIIIIAGPHGVGKTTFAREYLLKEAHCPDFINVDLIAAGLSERLFMSGRTIKSSTLPKSKGDQEN